MASVNTKQKNVKQSLFLFNAVDTRLRGHDVFCKAER